jgi:hypothetical protein
MDVILIGEMRNYDDPEQHRDQETAKSAAKRQLTT